MPHRTMMDDCLKWSLDGLSLCLIVLYSCVFA